MEIQLEVEEPGMVLGRTGPLVVAVYRGETTVESLAALEALQTKLLKSYPRIATFTVITGVTMGGAPAGVREKSAELRAKFDKQLIASVIVVRVTGLAGVVARTFLAAFSLASWGAAPMKTFREVAEAATWLRAFPGMLAEIRVMDGLDQAIERFSSQKAAAAASP